MPNGKLGNTPVNNACLYLLKEWQKQEKETRYKIFRLRKLFELLGAALVNERDRTELVVGAPENFSLDPMVRQD
jgi:hypothetical protein